MNWRDAEHDKHRAEGYRLGQLHFRLRASTMLGQQTTELAGEAALNQAARWVRELKPELELAEPTVDPLSDEVQRLKEIINDLLDVNLGSTDTQGEPHLVDLVDPAVEAAMVALSGWAPPTK